MKSAAGRSRRPWTACSLLPLSVTQPAATGQNREMASSRITNAVGSQQAAFAKSGSRLHAVQGACGTAMDGFQTGSKEESDTIWFRGKGNL